MSIDPTTSPTRPVYQDALVGAILGALSGTFAPLLGLDTEGTASIPRALFTIGLFGAAGGAIVAVVLRMTWRFRQQGPIQHYLSWILASMIAMLVLLLPDVPTKGWSTVGFALFLGGCVGLAFGAIARRLNRPLQ